MPASTVRHFDVSAVLQVIGNAIQCVTSVVLHGVERVLNLVPDIVESTHNKSLSSGETAPIGECNCRAYLNKNNNITKCFLR